MTVWFAAAISRNAFGGVGRTMRELSAGLSRLGYSAVVIHEPERGFGANYLAFALMLGMRLACCRTKPDAIIARSTDGLFCALICRAFGLKTKVFLHNHGWEEKVFAVERRLSHSVVTSPTTWKARLVRFPLLRLTLRLCSGCLNGALGEARWLKRRYPRYAAKQRYLPNGVRPQSGRADRPDFAPTFLVVGGSTWKKDVVYALKLFVSVRRRVPDARLFWVGAGTPGPAEASALRDAGDSVTTVQPVPFDQVAQWYLDCSCLLSTSRYEGGHSLAILEAMNAGMVVFASAIDSTTEIIRDGSNGHLLTGSDVAMDAAKIAQALGDRVRLAAVGEAARRTALRNRWERQVARLDRILRGRA
jgi:glycosyltransferase involved in cell wall biosynthesis